jgi:hypothetical protein
MLLQALVPDVPARCPVVLCASLRVAVLGAAHRTVLPQQSCSDELLIVVHVILLFCLAEFVARRRRTVELELARLL